MTNKKDLIAQFINCRELSEKRCEALSAEDLNIQAAEFASPGKWHLAHTSWFFETFILLAEKNNYCAYHPSFQVLFNSYYNGIGEQHPRNQRGNLSRPSFNEVLDYRKHVTENICELLEACDQVPSHISELIKLGIEHEKQHQELFITDLKFNLFQNPLKPTVKLPDFSDCHAEQAVVDRTASQFVKVDATQTTIGQAADDFYFDNESPQHEVTLPSFSLSTRLVTNGDYLNFIQNGGYKNPLLWLSDGWSTIEKNHWAAPLYWVNRDNCWYEYRIDQGLQALDLDQPVRHLSGYEADAFANWAGARLPTEQEWEHAANNQELQQIPAQMFDQCWQWTGSAYRPYPGYKVSPGAVGEYNGKFMSNQWVLRGSSIATSAEHSRTSYRNFFYPQDRWQYSGIRLAK